MTMKPKTMEAAAMAEENVATAASKGFETTVSGLKDGMSQGRRGLYGNTGQKVKAGMEKAMKTAEELVAFSQGNVEALVKSGQVWAAGVPDRRKAVAGHRAGLVRWSHHVDLQGTLGRSSR